MAKGMAENLSEVLEMARSRRYSGMMLIEHKQGGKLEEGEVFFQTGQPIHARVGRLNGQDALNWIMRWHSITYTVASDEDLQSVALPTTTQPHYTSPTPTNVFPNANPSTEPIVSQTQANRRVSIVSNASTPGIEWLIPQKRGIESEVLALPLTRPQRFIYFLVDGHRTVADLARCTGKNTREIEFILSELQEQGLVAV
jgi:hypothetical protein